MNNILDAIVQSINKRIDSVLEDYEFKELLRDQFERLRIETIYIDSDGFVSIHYKDDDISIYRCGGDQECKYI